MCLIKLLSEEKTKKLLDKLPDKITVYKAVIVDKYNKQYKPIWRSFFGSYNEGVNLAKTDMKCDTFKKVKKFLFFYEFIEATYYSGFHFWQKKEDAEGYAKISEVDLKVIECQVDKEDITAVGKDLAYLNEGIAFVTKKATFPKYED